MNRFETLTTAIVLAVALGVPATLSAGPGGGGPPTTMEGTVTVINLEQGIIRLSDGTELRTTDPQQLQAVKVGDHVQVMFEDRAGRNMLMRIAPVKQ